jgi:hypothetical protein
MKAEQSRLETGNLSSGFIEFVDPVNAIIFNLYSLLLILDAQHVLLPWNSMIIVEYINDKTMDDMLSIIGNAQLPWFQLNVTAVSFIDDRMENGKVSRDLRQIMTSA